MTKDLVTCPIENTVKLLNRKWTIVLIRDMFLGKKRFLEFKQNNPNLSNTVLSGGTGSLGAMAIPIAKSFGLEVMTGGSARNEERVTALGVDEFFDYRTQDYSEILSDVDYVLDTLGEKELEKEFKILKHGGSLVSLKGLPTRNSPKEWVFHLLKKHYLVLQARNLINWQIKRIRNTILYLLNQTAVS